MRARLVLLGTAVALSVIAGALGWLNQLVFSDHESATVRIGAYLPSVLWIFAIVAVRVPRAALAAFMAVTIAMVGLQVSPDYRLHY
jgi:hypothetical protein